MFAREFSLMCYILPKNTVACVVFPLLAVRCFAFQRAVTVEDCSGELREGSPNPSGLVVATALTHQIMSRV